ncbi:MAG: hypothetical protein RMN53_07130 [Anaerolineae bacterium]|nr:hypothetical protein [Anaerolineae bacterium]
MVPIRVGVSSRGVVTVTLAERLTTPIGTFDLGISGSIPIRHEINQLRYSQALATKRILIVRVDDKATVYELEPNKEFEVSVSSGAGYRKVDLAVEADGDIVLEIESVKPTKAAPAPLEREGPSLSAPTFSAACPRPEACITFPKPNDRISGIVAFRGTAIRDGFQYYKFEFRPETRPDYAYLVHFEAPVVHGVLMEWDTRTVPSGPYWLRLVVVDRTGNYWPEFAEIRVIVAN